MLCDDVLLEDYNADIIKTEGDSTCITTNNYTLKMQNPANGMPGTRIEFKASDKFELIIFAYKS